MEFAGPAVESAAQVFTGLAAGRFGEEVVSISRHEEQPLEVGAHRS